MKWILKRLCWGIFGAIIAILFFGRFCEKIMKKLQDSIRRNKQNFMCANSWLSISDSRGTIAEWLKDSHFSEIAIYGMGYLGKHLLSELENTDINIKYVIDRNPDKVDEPYICYAASEELPEVQVIIITLVYDFESIKESLNVMENTEIISLEMILNSICKRNQL